VCGPAPSIIQPPRTAACDGIDVAVAGTTLLWADRASGQVLRAPATAGAPTAIATGEDRPRALAIGGDEVFWLAGVHAPDGGALPIPPGVAIRAAPLAGGVARTVAAPAEGVNAFTVTSDGRTVYYGTSTRIEKASTAPQSAPVVVVAPSRNRSDFYVGLALDGSMLAFIGQLAGDVDAARLADGQIATCSSVQNPDPASTVLCNPVGRDINGRTLVTTGGMAYFHDGAVIKRGSLTAGFMQVVLAQVDGQLTDLSMSSDALLASADGPSMSSDGTILELPFAVAEQGATIRLARSQNSPASVATDGARVYWSTGDCAVKAIPLR
jgi:hypothetical protein